MLEKLKRKVARYLANIPGWRSDRRIIVFESDDWGSIRMPSKKAFNNLLEAGIRVDMSLFNRFDSLESNSDLIGLYEIIYGFKDKNGNHPAFTAVCVIANPDFEKIKASGFKEYFYEPFSETLKRYPVHNQVLNLWKEGAEKRLFVPQFHGREHLNVQRWMRDLQAGNVHTLLGFENHLWGITSDKIAKGYQAAFDLDSPEDLPYLHSVLNEGINVFEQLMGYKPEFFVPPNGPFNLSLEKTLQDKGIKYIMLEKLQQEPLGNDKYKIHIRWLGMKNKFGQIILSRNGEFEPSAGGKDWVGSCLKDIEIAFRMKKPATISTHRVNYVGFLEPSNRDQSLKLLKELLSKILKQWPDVEFMTSSELGSLIEFTK